MLDHSLTDLVEDPVNVQNQAELSGDDGTEGSVNKKIWAEVFENDIILTLPQAEALLTESGRTRGKRQAQPTPNSFWPNLTISYEFAYQDASFQNLIRSALRHIEQNTCIRFNENGPDRDGLKYFRGSGCWSNVGKTGGRQLVSIGHGCDSLGIIAHETLHALGLWHEQSRDDRDKFIRIVTDRIIRGTEGNFEKRTSLTSDNMGQPYDLGSVMHYGAKAFTYDWSFRTIETKDKRFQNTIGQRDGISFKDAKMINLRYCTKLCRRPLPCANEGYTDPNDCNKCRCPKGYGGTYCTQLERTSCGGELTATSQLQKYESGEVYANMNCIWRIKSPAGQRVQLIFDTVNFPCLDACTSFVEVKATISKTATGARLCCQSEETFYSEDDEIILIFKGDSQLQAGYQGFSVRYRYYGNAVRTTEPYPTYEPITSTPTTTTSLRSTTTTVNGAEWGIWGEWGSCSATCGGGQRMRVRGCYGGNRNCPGSAWETQSCNTRSCSVDSEEMCHGRILLPCDMAGSIAFGQDSYRSSTAYSSNSNPQIYADTVDTSFLAYPSLKRRGLARTSIGYGICEKRFTFRCPTSLLTIHMNWRKESSAPVSTTPPCGNKYNFPKRRYHRSR
ncbi:hypothetical protein Y032_0114g444 [Ancylostoma ceylanicum]|nr:hypothetical protein Y032_0114g444 [Ancylostoma ceylanicum]